MELIGGADRHRPAPLLPRMRHTYQKGDAKMGNITTFVVRTTPPRGRNTWTADTGSKVEAGLFATVAMLVAENADAEARLMRAIAEAKAGTCKEAV